MKKAILASAVFTLLCSGVSFAQEGPPSEPPKYEPFTVPVAPPGGLPATPPADQPDVQEAEDAAVSETAEPAPSPEKPKKSFLNLPPGWSGAVELGLSGSDGNTENFNLRAAFDLARKVGLGESALNLTYRYSAEGGNATANRFVASARHDQRFSSTSKWRYFITAVYEFDEFQDWRHRLTLGNGLGYAFVEDGTTKLIGRLGIGASKRWGGADENWIPEGILGFDFEHKLSERTSVYATVNYLPDLSDFPQFRLNSTAGLKVVVDPELGLNLHTGFEDRYDSNPGPGSRRNDIDYFLMLGWKF